MSSLGSRIRHTSGLVNRESIGRDLVILAHKSQQIARSIIELDISGRQAMSDILDGYAQIVRMLEVRLNDTEVSGAQGAALTPFHARTHLLDHVDTWLEPVEIEAMEALHRTEEALELATRVFEETSEAQGEITNKWNDFRTSCPKWLAIVPWTTVSHNKREHLAADLEMTAKSLSELSEARVDLNHLANDLAAYRRSVKVSRDGNRRKQDIGFGEDEMLLLVTNWAKFGRKLETRLSWSDFCFKTISC